MTKELKESIELLEDLEDEFEAKSKEPSHKEETWNTDFIYFLVDKIKYANKKRKMQTHSGF